MFLRYLASRLVIFFLRRAGIESVLRVDVFEVPGFTFGGLNGVVVSVADCYPKGAGFDSRVMLGIFPLSKRGLRTLV
jgi:hypothetical protein